MLLDADSGEDSTQGIGKSPALSIPMDESRMLGTVINAHAKGRLQMLAGLSRSNQNLVGADCQGTDCLWNNRASAVSSAKAREGAGRFQKAGSGLGLC